MIFGITENRLIQKAKKKLHFKTRLHRDTSQQVHVIQLNLDNIALQYGQTSISY
jgi:hypothetical protein